jgi:hypothetical protein
VTCVASTAWLIAESWAVRDDLAALVQIGLINPAIVKRQ